MEYPAFDQTVLDLDDAEEVGPPDVDEWGLYLKLVKGTGPRLCPVTFMLATIGRAVECDVVIADVALSRVHCGVKRVGDAALVTDLNSTNGTLVNGHRIAQPTALAIGDTLQIGDQLFVLEQRSVREAEVAIALDRDLVRASDYVLSLLPAPVVEGSVLVDWIFVPSTRLGGDGFGYSRLDNGKFNGFVLDVAGHGTGAAMLSVSVMNVLRNNALPNVDMSAPDQVVAALNTMFQMESSSALYFTIWYGVYDESDGVLRYCSAGQHPAILLAPAAERGIRLRNANPAVGLVPQFAFRAGSVHVERGSSLYLFSDGIFEVETRTGSIFRLADFERLMLTPAQPGVARSRQLLTAMQQIGSGFEDDASLVVINFQ